MAEAANYVMPKTATIVITTKNRREELRKALRTCVAQADSPDVLVIDDGSHDGTSDMVRGEFPGVSVIQHGESKGLIVRRNEAARLVTNDVIVSIDDDAELSQPDIVRQTLSDFEHPAIAAVAIPFTNVRQSNQIHQLPPDNERIWITNEYIGTAHAVRREVFLELGGYRESLIHQHEEGDFCIRLMDGGYFVRLGRANPVLHYESPKRSNERMEVFGQRNLILFAWYNVPLPNLLWHLPATVVNGLRWGVRNRCLSYRCRGTIAGIEAIRQQLRDRSPVSIPTNRLYRQLKRRSQVLHSGRGCDSLVTSSGQRL